MRSDRLCRPVVVVQSGPLKLVGTRQQQMSGYFGDGAESSNYFGARRRIIEYFKRADRLPGRVLLSGP